MLIDNDALKPQNNNLTLLRLALASAVIWTHSIWRITGIEGDDGFAPFIGVPISSFAVDGFFFLSGLLVYSSLLRQRGVKNFALARLARLWPALALSVIVTVAAGILFTSVSAEDYFSGATSQFLIGTLTLTGGHYALTGVYCGPNLCNVNGSLWTITWEVRCYILLALLSILGLSRPNLMKRIILPATFLGAIAYHIPGIQAAIEGALGHGVAYNLRLVDRLWTMFALGIAAFVWRDRITLSWLACGALLIATVAANRFGLDQWHIRSVFTGYFVLCAGFLSAKRGAISATWPDYSYGMYIYAFPVMMLLAAIIPFGSYVPLALATFACTLPCAALSWHLLEEPVLNLVRNRRKQQPLPTAAPITPDMPQEEGAKS